MANSSEKKAQQLYHQYYKIFLLVSIAIHLLYFFLRVWYRWDSFGWGTGFGYIVLTAINVIGFVVLMKYLEGGHPTTSYSYLQDILLINWVVLVGTIYSNYFWMLYLFVPVYIGYQYGPMLMSFLNRGSNPYGMTPEQQEQMGQQQQQATPQPKQKVKYMRG